MKTIIGVIKKSNFIESNYDEVLQGNFKEFTSSNVEYVRVNTFEKYAIANTFEEVFYSEDEFQVWLKEVPKTISKLQAISLLLQQGKYDALVTELDKDTTGSKKILFDAAHQLDINSNMVLEIAQALGFSDEDIYNFFITASNILV